MFRIFSYIYLFCLWSLTHFPSPFFFLIIIHNKNIFIEIFIVIHMSDMANNVKMIIILYNFIVTPNTPSQSNENIPICFHQWTLPFYFLTLFLYASIAQTRKHIINMILCEWKGGANVPKKFFDYTECINIIHVVHG